MVLSMVLVDMSRREVDVVWGCISTLAYPPTYQRILFFVFS